MKTAKPISYFPFVSFSKIDKKKPRRIVHAFSSSPRKYYLGFTKGERINTTLLLNEYELNCTDMFEAF